MGNRLHYNMYVVYICMYIYIYIIYEVYMHMYMFVVKQVCVYNVVQCVCARTHM
jgi:hypothetical protein